MVNKNCGAFIILHFRPSQMRLKSCSLKPAPLIREHRLYQADWLLRFYGFGLDEIVHNDMLDMEHDGCPQADARALRNRHIFPIDLNKADKLLLLRVPGLGGARTVQKILAIRRYTLA